MSRGFNRRNSKSDAPSGFDILAGVFMVGGIGLSLFYGYTRLEGLDEAVLGKHSSNYVAPDSRTEIMSEEPVNDSEINNEPTLLKKVIAAISSDDQAWLRSMIETEVTK